MVNIRLRHVTTADRPPYAAGAVIRDAAGERYLVIAPLRGVIDGRGPDWAAVRHLESGRQFVACLDSIAALTEEVAP